MSIAKRVPVVGSLAYAERVSKIPGTFSAALAIEPDNKYFRHAIAVLVDGLKVGYVAPEIAAGIYEGVTAVPGPLSCPGRRALSSDAETSGVQLLLDFSALALPVAS